MKEYKYRENINDNDGNTVGVREKVVPNNIVEQIKADAINEFAKKIMDIMPNDIDARVHNGSICLDILALAEQLKEQNK